MRTRLVMFVSVVLFIGGAIELNAAQVGSAASGPCDRACLQGFVEQHLDAWVARDPKRLPLTAKVKYTFGCHCKPKNCGPTSVS